MTRKHRLTLPLIVAGGLGVAACTSSDDEPVDDRDASAATDAPGGPSAGGAPGADAAGTSGSPSLPDGGTPAAPTVLSAEPLSGGLHVMWENPAHGCNEVELYRNESGGEYMRVTVLTGAAEAYHDADVSAGVTYCYRARCIIDGVSSEDSNERCGSP